jgi:hypothetical protein
VKIQFEEEVYEELPNTNGGFSGGESKKINPCKFSCSFVKNHYKKPSREHGNVGLPLQY